MVALPLRQAPNLRQVRLCVVRSMPGGASSWREVCSLRGQSHRESTQRLHHPVFHMDMGKIVLFIALEV